MNKIILLGRLTATPVIAFTKSETAVTKFTIAVNRKFAKKDDEKQADFISCTAWQKTAEFICKYLTKGQQVLFGGRIENNNYESEGIKHYGYSIICETIESVGNKKETEPKQGEAQYESVPDESELPF